MSRKGTNRFSGYCAVEPDKVKLNFAVISDTHIDKRKVKIRKLQRGLHNMEKSETLNDVLVCVGDMTDHGYSEQWQIAAQIFSGHKAAKETFLVIGNHDRWAKEDEPDFSEQFIAFSHTASGRELDKLYFSETINGYKFISLAKDNRENGVSDEQLEWLRGQMNDSTDESKPIFVFMHESLNISHGLPYTWERKWKDGKLPDPLNSGIGRRSDEVEAILKSRKNVFFFSGHIHLGLTGKKQYRKFGYSSVESDGTLHRVNVPCYMFPNHHGRMETGIGFQLEVYDNEVLIRPRSYTKGLWLTKYNKTIKLQ